MDANEKDIQQNQNTNETDQQKTDGKLTPGKNQAKKTSAAKDYKADAKRFFKVHNQYKENLICYRRLLHSDILPLIERLNNKPAVQITRIGASIENRDIFQVKMGTGKKKILLWSQMHGNEPTATMTIFDIFNFLLASDDFHEYRRKILENLSLFFIPMLNPDGAEMYRRRNAVGIDINRDALRTQSPEAKLLKKARSRIMADYAFNLHDQDIHYSVGTTNRPASISLLAPAFDSEVSMNPIRERAIKLSALMGDVLNHLAPGHIAKYSDTFTPRAFGDNMQKWGTSTILIESGGYPDDPDKQMVRRLNFASVLTALYAIAEDEIDQQNPDIYFDLPNNGKSLFDLIIRNVQLQKENHDYIIDIGINREEKVMDDYDHFYSTASIEEIGDMSVFYGYEELDAKGLQLIPGKIYPYTVKSIRHFNENNILELLDMGYTTVRVKRLPYGKDFSRIPINLIGLNERQSNDIVLHGKANFTLRRNGRTKYAVVNGYLFDLRNYL